MRVKKAIILARVSTAEQDKTGHNCTFITWKNSTVVRKNMYEVIQVKEGQAIQLNPYHKGFVIL